MADGKTSASVVAVDPERAAKERDAAARAMLHDTPDNKGMKQFLKKGLAHTVPFTFKAVAEEDKLEEVKSLCEAALTEGFQIADSALNVFNASSEVSMINNLPVGEKHTMSDPIKKVMACCVRVNGSSRGSFDPAVGKLLYTLREAAKQGTSIPVEQIREIAEKASLQKSFDINLKEGTIARKHADAALDLGGVSKGYTVDFVVEKLNAAGVQNVYFDWGGDIRASGVNATGNLWAVGIVRPPPLSDLSKPTEANASYIRVVQLHNEAIATSGDYENLIEGPGKKPLSSIFDWDNLGLLAPSESAMAQVSIKCYSCMYADAIATATLLKKTPNVVRMMLESWRYVRETVTDYTTYTRESERVACMFELATESAEMRAKRIAASLPARVIVIGGGLAGCSAAVEAANCGANVVLLEKEPKLGGNSAKATSGINAWGTRAQAEQNIQDGGKYFERDTYLSGTGGNCDPGLVKTLSVKSAEGIKFLTGLGVPLSVLSQLGGASRKRCHRAPDQKDGTPVPIGYTIMQILENHIRKKLNGKISVITNVSVKKLIHTKSTRPDGVVVTHVTGVEFIDAEGKDMQLSADAVVLSTGGFSNDRTTRSLLQEHAPHLASFPTTNGTWATGDGVKMAKELGVELVDMDKVQLHPTGLIDPKDPSHRTKYLGPEALRGSGGILLNKRGERFINELDLRSVVSQAIIAQNDEYPNSGGSKFAHCVLNEEAVKLFGVNSLGFYWKRLGLFEKVEDTAALAKLIGCPEETVVKTLKQYEEISSGNRVCPLTGKAVFPCKLGPQGPFYVAFVTPSIHYTMGGCLISPSGEIQTCEHDSEGLGQRRPILGLFGAGEVTGGVHGKNRLGGNSLLECVVFGKIAGDRAASFETTGRSGLLNRAVVTVTEVNPLFSGAGVEVVLSFTSSTVTSGLGLFQKIRVEDEASVESVVLLPSSSPLESGVIRVYLADGEPRWLSQLESFTKVHVAVEEDFYWKMEDASPLEINMLVLSHSGVAAVMQLLRHAKNNPTMFSRLNLFLSFSIEKNMLTKLVLAILHTTECSVTLDSRFAKQESYPDFKVDTLKNFVSISRLGRDRLDRMSRYFFAAGFSISQETNEELLALKSMNNLIHF